MHGALRAEGSPLELKAKYGLGYRLHISRTRVEPFSAGERKSLTGPPPRELGPPQDDENEWGVHSAPKAGTGEGALKVDGPGEGAVNVYGSGQTQHLLGRDAAEAILKLAVAHVPGARLVRGFDLQVCGIYIRQSMQDSCLFVRDPASMKPGTRCEIE